MNKKRITLAEDELALVLMALEEAYDRRLSKLAKDFVSQTPTDTDTIVDAAKQVSAFFHLKQKLSS